MINLCKHTSCGNVPFPNSKFCAYHATAIADRQTAMNSMPLPKLEGMPIGPALRVEIERHRASDRSLAQLYPKYYKPIPKGWDSIDVYGVHQIFCIADPSGALQHASKKILLSGVRTGGKSQFKDIKEARDALNRWLQMNPETLEETSTPK